MTSAITGAENTCGVYTFWKAIVLLYFDLLLGYFCLIQPFLSLFSVIAEFNTVLLSPAVNDLDADFVYGKRKQIPQPEPFKQMSLPPPGLGLTKPQTH